MWQNANLVVNGKVNNGLCSMHPCFPARLIRSFTSMTYFEILLRLFETFSCVTYSVPAVVWILPSITYSVPAMLWIPSFYDVFNSCCFKSFPSMTHSVPVVVWVLVLYDVFSSCGCCYVITVATRPELGRSQITRTNSNPTYVAWPGPDGRGAEPLRDTSRLHLRRTVSTWHG